MFNAKVMKEFFRVHCPNVRILRKLVSYMRLRQVMKYPEIVKLVNSNEEMDAKARESLLQTCKQKWPATVATVRKTAVKCLKESQYYKNRYEDEALLDDIVLSYFALSCKPDEYIFFGFEGKALKDRKEYITNRHLNMMHAIFNDLCESILFRNKYKTYSIYKKFFKREIIQIESSADFEKFNAFVSKHPVFVKKDALGALGISVGKVDMTKETRTVKEVFNSIIKDGKHVIEELVVQNEVMAAWNSSSVNTVRIISVLTRHGVKIPFGIIRVGNPGSFVDNVHFGGMCASIDTKTGILKTDGADNLGNIFQVHAHSGIKVKGFQLPAWQELLSLIDEAAQVVPTIPVIGWDFAYTDKGWVMIEGNAMSQIAGPQITGGKGIRKEFFAILKDVKPMLEDVDFEQI